MTNERRRREHWSDHEWALLTQLDERGPISDVWPNGRLLRACRVCGLEFSPKRKNDRGPFPIECGDVCRRVFSAWNTQQWREGRNTLPEECAWCFGRFEQDRNGSGNRSRFCSNECRLSAGNHMTCNALMDRCDVPRCTQCGVIGVKPCRKKSTKTGFIKRPRGMCGDCRRHREHRRDMMRALRPSRGLRARAIANGDRVTPQGVIDRCGNRCYLCGHDIDVTILDRNDPLHLEIDHIWPISRGGRDTWENTAPVHRVCNQRKGNRLVACARWEDGPVILL